MNLLTKIINPMKTRKTTTPKRPVEFTLHQQKLTGDYAWFGNDGKRASPIFLSKAEAEKWRPTEKQNLAQRENENAR
jgi:hypothetical protein